jgi:hypothetical protein
MRPTAKQRLHRTLTRLLELRQSLSGLKHHLGTAVVLASLFVILETLGLTNWLDTIALRIAFAAHGPGTRITVPLTNSEMSRDRAIPYVVTIGRDAYETTFHEASPLDRNAVRDLVSHLADASPAVLVIDIDLAPTQASNPQAQEDLDELLLHIAGRRQTHLVLATPGPVSTESAFERRYTWMKRLCSGGVDFAYPELLTTQGVVLRFDPEFPSLGVLAHAAAADKGQRRSPRETRKTPTPCANVMAGASHAVFLSNAFAIELVIEPADFSHQLPINSSFWKISNSVHIPISQTNDLPALSDAVHRAIFLGGNFDASDAFSTPSGELAGVFLHAAIFFSKAHPINALTHAKSMASDIILGLVLGALFTLLWDRYSLAASDLARADTPTFTLYARSRGWLILNLTVFFLALFLIFFASVWLLQRELWSCPAGMLAGTFLHGVLTSRGDHSAAHLTASTSSRRSRTIDYLLLTPLVIIALWIILSEH